MVVGKDEVCFENLPNFRQAGGKGLTNKEGKRIRDGLLYRSSRADFVTEKDVEEIHRLGIHAIVDLRPTSDLKKSTGDMLLVKDFEPCAVKKGQVKPISPTGALLRNRSKQSSDAPKYKHYMINVWTKDLIMFVFTQLNVFVRALSLILALIDFLCGTYIFVRFFAKHFLNKRELWENYLDILEYSKGPILDALRLIADKENQPVLVQCSHGKDRTGIIVAMILGCLLVDEEKIAEDYGESDVSMFFVLLRNLSNLVSLWT